MTIDKSLEKAMNDLTKNMKEKRKILEKKVEKCTWKVVNEKANELYLKLDTHALINGCDVCSGYKPEKSCYYVKKEKYGRP